MRKIAIILAGGRGLRAGGEIPKQFQLLAGKPMLWWSFEAFKKEDSDTEIIFSVHPDFTSTLIQQLNDFGYTESIDYKIVSGGNTRWQSVENALSEINISDETALVAVHDGARPLVSPDLIARGWACATANGSAVPCIELSDSIRRITEQNSSAENRSNFRLIQTPQIFDFHHLRHSYDSTREEACAMGERMRFTDDASVIEECGYPVSLYKGDVDNIKITHPRDFRFAEVILSQHLL